MLTAQCTFKTKMKLAKFLIRLFKCSSVSSQLSVNIYSVSQWQGVFRTKYPGEVSLQDHTLTTRGQSARQTPDQRE